MKVAIRRFIDEDLEQLKTIILKGENFGEPFLNSELQRIKIYQKAPELGTTYVAVNTQTKNVIGYICLEYKWRSLVIQSMITHYMFLRKGVGTKLVEKAISIGEKHPTINIVRVDTGDFMGYAQKFYLSCGFQICGFVKHDMSWFNHQVHFVYPLKGVEKKDK